MNQLQIKATIIGIEAKSDKNHNPYWRLSLQGLPDCYFYAFSFRLNPETLATLTNVPENFLNRSVLITYQELPNQNNLGTFCQVSAMEIV